MDEVRKLLSRWCIVARAELPRFAGGAVGFLGYDSISFFEPTVSLAPNDELHLPEMVFMITGKLLIFDHRLRSLKIVVNAFLEDGAPEEIYQRAAQSINAIGNKLAEPADLPLIFVKTATHRRHAAIFGAKNLSGRLSRQRSYIRAGDIFQVVLSQRFESDFAGGALDFYRCLRFINPSPYMFCLNFGEDFALVGSSPEMHVRLTGHMVEIRPIAGTRPRGGTAREDEANARELLADPKERAEHIMLVDLARNDIGRVAEFGSVRVTEFMNIERYSHVMHIVSNVSGHLRAAATASI